MRLLLLWSPQSASAWLEIDILIKFMNAWRRYLKYIQKKVIRVLRGTQNDVILELFKELEMFSLEKEDSGTWIPSSNVLRAVTSKRD